MGKVHFGVGRLYYWRTDSYKGIVTFCGLSLSKVRRLKGGFYSGVTKAGHRVRFVKRAMALGKQGKVTCKKCKQ